VISSFRSTENFHEKVPKWSEEIEGKIYETKSFDGQNNRKR
jgi:hypothetical protein